MVEESGLPGSVSGTRPPEQLGDVPRSDEDNARKRFRLERERRRAEKSRKEPTDRPVELRDHWDGEQRRDQDPPGSQTTVPDPPGGQPTVPVQPGGQPTVPVQRPAKDEDRREGGLDVVA